jgi:hypothetical protein
MTDEVREELMGAITDGMIREMTFEDLRQFVWNCLYDDLLSVSEWELEEYAKKYAVDWLDVAG